MDYIVTDEQANGLRTKSVTVLMKDNAAYRRAEVVLPAGTDAATWMAANGASAWAAGSAVDASWWLAAKERQYKAYYYTVLRSVDGVRAAGGTLDMALGAGLQAINLDETKRAEFDQWRTMCQLVNPETVQDKRDLLVAVLAFANAGLVGGARL